MNKKTIRVTDGAEVNAALNKEADRRALDVFCTDCLGTWVNKQG